MQKPTEDLHRVISYADARFRLGISKPLFWKLKREGKLPPVVHVSERRRGFLLSDLVSWIEARRAA